MTAFSRLTYNIKTSNWKHSTIPQGYVIILTQIKPYLALKYSAQKNELRICE